MKIGRLYLLAALGSIGASACYGGLIAGQPTTGTFSFARISTDPGTHYTNDLLGGPNLNASAGITDVTDVDLFASASTDIGTNRATAGSALGNIAWAGSYWADTITLTGGTGAADVHFALSLGGSIAGNGSVRYRFSLSTPVGGFPFDSLTDPNFFTAPYSDNANTFDMLCCDPGFGAYSQQGDVGFGLGFSTSLDYGTPYMMQVFLEAYSADGGVADFFDPGHFDVIEVPWGTNVAFGSGGADAAVTVIPEPAVALLIGSALTAIGLLRRRRG